MLNAYSLTEDVIKRQVPRSKGVYYLIQKHAGGLEVQYVGRSDSNIQGRLLQHAATSRYSHFRFVVTDSIYQAYQLECREWHRLRKTGALKNQIHPDAPNYIGYSCRYCRLSLLSKSSERSVRI